MTGLAAQTVADLAEFETPEWLVPSLDEDWQCVKSATQANFHIQEYLPAGQTTGDWAKIVTVTRIARADVTPQAYMELLRRAIEGKVVDGRLSWEVLSSSEDQLIYESTLEDDVAAQDQTELVRIVRRGTTLHTLQYAVRGDLALAARAKTSRLTLLRSADFERRPPPVAETAPTVDDPEVAAILRLATAPSDEPPANRLAALRRGLSVISKDRHLQPWAVLNLILALLILELDAKDAISDEGLDEAVASLRRALEVFNRDQEADRWARALKALGLINVKRARRRGRGNGPAATEAAQISLRHAIAAFDKARTAFKPGSFDWALVMVELGDARLSVDLDAAASTYEEMLAAVENTPPLPEGERSEQHIEALGGLGMRAIQALQDIDRLRDGSPVIPTGYLDRPMRGKLLYLRPLLSAGHLHLKNRCVPGAFVVGYEREPDELSLEALLYRALVSELNFMTLGGRPEGYGGTRIIMAAGGEDWSSMLPDLEKDADIVLVVPHVSEGVRWEIEYLAQKGALDKTLFIMPPPSTDTDVEAMWSGAAALMAECGLIVPGYRPRGAILRFGHDGSVAEEWEFDTLWDNTFLREINHLLPPW